MGIHIAVAQDQHHRESRTEPDNRQSNINQPVKRESQRLIDESGNLLDLLEP